jgi:hypothetical protein
VEFAYPSILIPLESDGMRFVNWQQSTRFDSKYESHVGDNRIEPSGGKALGHQSPGNRRACDARGAVTQTEFSPAPFGSPGSDSCRGGGSPRPESFFSEVAERAAGCKMARDVEGVLNGGVNGQEALG